MDQLIWSTLTSRLATCYSHAMAAASSTALAPSAQVAAHIRALVRDGQLLPGERLPSSRDLADELGVAKGTILAAYGTLRDMGVIRAVWHGYVVADDADAADDRMIRMEIDQFVAALVDRGVSRAKIRAAIQRALKERVL